MHNPNTNPISLFFKVFTKNCPGALALILVVTTCSMWFMEKEVPDELQNIMLIVVSFFFGKSVTSTESEKENGNN